MRFDDRLSTVLAQPVTDARDRAVRWRQLVDLVARSEGSGSPALVAAALVDIRSEARSLPEDIRAAAARSIAGRPLPVGLIAAFAADTVAVAAPLMASAKLQDEAWDTVRREASADVRALIDSLHQMVAPPLATAHEALDQLGEAMAGAIPPAPSEVPSPGAAHAERPLPAGSGDIPSISEVLARIERLRRSREGQVPPPPAADLEAPTAAPAPAFEQVVEQPRLFKWECGPSGEIAWVEGAPRGALIGRSLAQDPQGQTAKGVRRAIARRSPFQDELVSLEGAGALSGEWRISGTPLFEPNEGRFIGYRGIGRRAEHREPPPTPAPVTPATRRDSASLRELVHEIKTPLNAIIGFAEIIDGQYLGPAHRRYRERAAEIVQEARALLGAVDDLDLAARLQGGVAEVANGGELNDIAQRVGDELRPAAENAGVHLVVERSAERCRCAVDAVLAERLAHRFLQAVLGAADPGDHLVIRAGKRNGRALLFVGLPSRLRGISHARLLDADVEAVAADGSAGLGLGFQLRLVRGLARVAAGDLVVDAEALVLMLPAAEDEAG